VRKDEFGAITKDPSELVEGAPVPSSSTILILLEATGLGLREDEDAFKVFNLFAARSVVVRIIGIWRESVGGRSAAGTGTGVDVGVGVCVEDLALTESL
jgi:hypothetical protein